MVFSSSVFIYYFLPAFLALYYILPRLIDLLPTRLRQLAVTIIAFGPLCVGLYYCCDLSLDFFPAAWEPAVRVIQMIGPWVIAAIGAWFYISPRLRDLLPRRIEPCLIAYGSYIFYGWKRPDFVLLMLLSTGTDFIAAHRIVRAQAEGKKGKAWLIASMTVNLGLLAYFKYANFGVETWNSVIAGLAEGNASFPLKQVTDWTTIALPIGISFYTFHTMSYTIDVYWKHAPPVIRLWDFMCYVALFPQLVAGPIARYNTIADQFQHREHTLGKFFQGILYFQIGLAKKLLIADIVAQVADVAFASQHLSWIDSWVGVVAYAFQIYFDFSGYSDMAIGLALMLGFTLQINFNSPYHSKSITEFWRRWHISLSTWLRDYLYIPLGGNRKGTVRTYVNLALTMLLGGLWHGAAWTFVIWGAWQGFWLIVERLMAKRPLYGWAPAPVQVLLTFILVLIGWVFFRAPNIGTAWAYINTMFGFGASTGIEPIALRPIHTIGLAIAALLTWLAPTTHALLARAPIPVIYALQPIFLIALAQSHYEDYVPFLYFQF